MSESDIDPVDRYVGQRVRARRKEVGISQEALGEGGRVTFQQIQKYERGANRISASMMVRLAQALGVWPGYFFEGMPEDFTTEAPGDRIFREFAASDRGRDLLDAAMDLPDHILLAHVALMNASVAALERAFDDQGAEEKKSPTVHAGLSG